MFTKSFLLVLLAPIAFLAATEPDKIPADYPAQLAKLPTLKAQTASLAQTALSLQSEIDSLRSVQNWLASDTSAAQRNADLKQLFTTIAQRQQDDNAGLHRQLDTLQSQLSDFKDAACPLLLNSHSDSPAQRRLRFACFEKP